LRIWLPAQFDPAGEGPAARLLQARLDEFTSRRPGVRLEVRLKATEGPGGLLDALTNARAAAPLALPDLVALPRPTLEAAALKGLVHSYDEFLPAAEDQDWYSYATQLGRLQESTFGLPFAGDALVLVYRTTSVDAPPASLAEALQKTGPLAFPAADPQALFTLSLYQAAGGPLWDEQERPTLEPATLAQVLTFYQQGAISELLPFWLTQYATDEQAWQAFESQQAEMAVTWASRYLQNMPADTAAAPLPTPDGEPFTLATGWDWALASTNPERLALSVDLATFLTESPFLAEWNAAAGYLPPRPSALASWRSPSLQPLAAGLSESARLVPSAEVLTSLAPIRNCYQCRIEAAARTGRSSPGSSRAWQSLGS
jgi:ABC-type glycerol-3-phosphate transport system substrate-binding protein